MADRQRTVSRRGLLKSSAAAATLTIIPRQVLGGPGRPSANERLNIAAVGVGGMGVNNLAACAGENIVALCDVDAGGILFVGDKGLLMCGCFGKGARLIPESRMKEYQIPAPTLPRVPGGESGHEKDWVRACKDGKPSSVNFDYSGPFAETVLMGNLAIRFPYRELQWGGAKMEVTNDKDANAYVRRQYREGWTL